MTIHTKNNNNIDKDVLNYTIYLRIIIFKRSIDIEMF